MGVCEVIHTCMDWTMQGLDFHSLWGWVQMFPTTAYLVLFYFCMNRRKIRIIFKAKFYPVYMIGFPSLGILLPQLRGKICFVKLEKVCLKQLQKFVISQRLLDTSFPTCAHPWKREKESLDTFPVRFFFFHPETFRRAFTYAVYRQNIATCFGEPFPSVLH